MPAAAPCLKILHVDDDRINLFVLDQLLGMLGHAPTGVGTALEALELLDTKVFDLVLTDVHMPELSGMDLLTACRERLGEAAPPVVAVTADVMSWREHEFRELGFAGVITKPLIADELVRLLAAVSAPAETRAFAAAGLRKRGQK